METETATTSPTDVASLIKIGDFPAFDQGVDTRVIGTTDRGKTAWADGDKVLLKLQKNDTWGAYESHLCYTLTYASTSTSWNSDTPINRVIDDYDRANIDVTAYYAPTYEWSEASKQEKAGLPSLIDGKQAGTDECLVYTATNVSMRDGITIDFKNTLRPYSRLRIATGAGATVQLTPSKCPFTPAGSESALSDAAPLSATADVNGNAFFYGTWTGSGEFNFIAAQPSKISEVKTTITNASTGGSSYAVDATKTIDVASMNMTIDTSKNTDNTSDATFILPIDEGISGYRLFVDWGDGKISVFNDGTTPDQANRTHTYPQAGEYTITISSSQTTPANQQMSIFDFSADALS